MTDIVDRLRETAVSVRTTERRICDESADEIKRLREALQNCVFVMQAEVDLMTGETAWQKHCRATVSKARDVLGEDK